MTIRIRNPKRRYTVIPVDLRPDQVEAVRAMARANGISVSRQIVRLCNQRLALGATCALVLALTFASPRAEAGYIAYGVGIQKCRAMFTYDPAANSSFDSWLGGFISGLNAGGHVITASAGKDTVINVTKSADFWSIRGVVMAVCHRHPSMSVADAAFYAVSTFAR